MLFVKHLAKIVLFLFASLFLSRESVEINSVLGGATWVPFSKFSSRKREMIAWLSIVWRNLCTEVPVQTIKTI